MKKTFKIPMSILMVFAIVFSALNLSVFAEEKESNDEYNFELVQKDDNIVIAKATHENGDELYATLDKATSEITLEAVEKPKGLLKFGDDKTTKYIVKAETIDPALDVVDVTIIDETTKSELRISPEYVQAQLPVLVPVVTWGGRALLLWLMEHALAMTIAGITAYVATDLISDIRKSNKNYWPAWIRNNNVYIGGDAFDTDYQAVGWVKTANSGEYNLWARTEAKAKEAANKAAGTNVWHQGKPTDGHYDHYHPAKPLVTDPWVVKLDNHLWY
ncbi:hypothetical protein PAEVO_43330 [Paenibacillus sp. GM2FR]|uniref:hypothetical protein n=1 Tax=Paenibacillus sp. GM2FR TaxID=2059268 RepID=UPI000C26F8AF|nr:hypothetical protein [Paenibacillus sp. GM2FR]PJN51242.1 hypothetical protein PAEVO_43330 [Paenibacillus sp. GM2FR]